VFVDGEEKGSSPVAIERLVTGDHVVSIRDASGVVERTVRVVAGQSTSVILAVRTPPPDPSAVIAGWLAVSSPVPLQVRENGRLVGSTALDRVMLPAGDHLLDLVNTSLAFHVQRSVHVAPGRTTPVRVDVPNGTFSLDALPWAEVFVDGQRVGETPIENLRRPIGRHEVVFRHPDFGDRREVITVTTHPGRLDVELRNK
jgi:PEGA domain-containing protein